MLQSFKEWAKDNYQPQRDKVIIEEVKPDIVEQKEVTEVEEKEEEDNYLNFNEWKTDDWTKVAGIGPKLAQRLVESGPYDSVNDVKEVKGISEKVFKEIEKSIS